MVFFMVREGGGWSRDEDSSLVAVLIVCLHGQGGLRGESGTKLSLPGI
jgi:hypothetical protein